MVKEVVLHARETSIKNTRVFFHHKSKVAFTFLFT